MLNSLLSDDEGAGVLTPSKFEPTRMTVTASGRKKANRTTEIEQEIKPLYK